MVLFFFFPSTMVLLGIVLLFICQAQIPRNVLIRCSGLCVDMSGVLAVGVTWCFQMTGLLRRLLPSLRLG